jgi:threonine dehydratase
MFKVRGDIFMPKNTTHQKIQRVKLLGGDHVRIFLEGDTFDACYAHTQEHCRFTNQPFIHPFDDEKVIEGQGTVGLEILEQLKSPIDYIVLPIGGGGLAAGVSTYIRECSPSTTVIGAGPLGAPAMYQSLLQNQIVTLDSIVSFVDGASVKRVGERNFPIVQANLKSMLQIEEGHVCSKILEMYNECGVILEPAGVLSLCALDNMDIRGKTVVAILSGGNSDVFRMPEILERSLLYEGKKHYYRVEFSQRAGSLKEFVMNILEKEDDIIYFRYTKRLNQETGPVILGIETKTKQDGIRIETNMKKKGIVFVKLRGQVDL